MTNPTPTDVARLRELAEAATPGPWRFGDVWSGYGSKELGSEEIGKGFAAGEKAVVTAYNSHCCQFADDIIVSDADAALIVAAVNALPGLLDRLAACEGWLRRLAFYPDPGSPGCWCDGMPGTDEPHDIICDQLRAALGGSDDR